MMKREDIHSHNEKAWDLSVHMKNRWTIPVSKEQIINAQKGDLSFNLGTEKPIPPKWYGKIKGKKILGLAAGGGQQGPLWAAAGAEVTICDISSKQLEQDRLTCQQYDLPIHLIQTPSDDLSMLKDESFDLIINPISNCFFPKLEPVWSECARLLKPRGTLIYGFINPITYLFDFEKANQGLFQLKYSLPYSDLTSLNEEEKKKYIGPEVPLEYSHTLSEQITLLLAQGFVIEDLFEDLFDPDDPISSYFSQCLAIKAKKKF